MSESQKITLCLDKQTFQRVIEQAANNSEVRTKWITDAIKARLNEHNFGDGIYAKAVSAVYQAGSGKLNRTDAESIAAKVITVMHQS